MYNNGPLRIASTSCDNLNLKINTVAGIAHIIVTPCLCIRCHSVTSKSIVVKSTGTSLSNDQNNAMQTQCEGLLTSVKTKLEPVSKALGNHYNSE